MKRLSTIFLAIMLIPALAGATVNLDSDYNGYVDLIIGGTNTGDEVTARQNLGVEIGTDVQAWSPFLQYITNLTAAPADRILFFDQSSGIIDYLIIGTGLSITDKTMTATGGGGGGSIYVNTVEVVDPDFTDNSSILFTNPAGSTVNATLAEDAVYAVNISETAPPVDGQFLAFNQAGGNFSWADGLDPAADLAFTGDNTNAGSATFNGPLVATNTVTLPDGSVGGAALTDDTVTEPKLDVTNTGTSGQVLAHDGAAGFTWVDQTTEPGDGSIDTLQLADGAVTNPKIADDTILAAKLDATNLATDNLILSYDDTTGGFTWVADSIGTAFDPTANIAFTGDNTHTGVETFTNIVNMPASVNWPAGTIGTTELADNAVINSKMADNSINAAEIVDGSVGSLELGAASVTEAKIAGTAVNESHLNVTNAPTDDYVLSYNQAGLNFTWVEQSAGGGVTAASGTSLQPVNESFLVRVPEIDDEWFLFKAPTTLTIQSFDCISQGGTSANVQLQECGPDGTGCAALATSTACTATGAGGAVNYLIEQDNWVKISVPSVDGATSVTGTITSNTLAMENVVIESPVEAEEYLTFKAPYDFNILNIHCIADGGTSAVIDVKQCDSTGASCTSVDDTLITCDLDGAVDDGSLSNGSVSAGDWISVAVGTVTGDVSTASISIHY